MRDELLEYYERELTFLRQSGAEFAERYPKIASRLMIEPTKCEDPHVERLLEGFAFLAARVHLKIDDDLPEISQSLLDLVYPHYVRPIPSVSVVEFRSDPEQGKLTTGFKIARQSLLYSRPVGGTPCKFRTCYDTTLWPLAIESAEWKTPERIRPPIRTGPETGAVLRLELRCFQDITLDKLDGLESLRLFINAESNLAFTLYELLGNNVRQIIIRDLTPGSKRSPVVLPASAIQPAGFQEDEALLPYPKRSFTGYRLLQEYFTFPQKFLFYDLSGLDRVVRAGFGGAAEVLILFSPFERAERQQFLEVGVSAETLRLGCTPVINLFEQTSEPILLNQRVHEYLVVPDARRRQSTETFSIDEVLGVKPRATAAIRYAPLYSYHHASTPGRAFWFATRRLCGWRSDGSTDLYLSFADLSGRPALPEEDSLTLHLTCFNRDLPSRLPFGNPDGDFELEGGGPVRGVIALLKPTPVIQPPLGKSLHWRLVSQLSLNYLSIVDGGVAALREILRLYNFADLAFHERQLQGIVDVSSRPALTQITSEEGVSFVRGRRVEIEFDEEQFTGGGVYLFASLLERFLGLYVSLNSFTILAARTRQRKEALRQWLPRTGNRVLI
ncbi:MAG TPA: type VI secretion system baseplate subunit TssF [Bryobacteraceae bacterium]|nr:type VI secretion system baseplate subunit TssF [Bryobacteraceae bacterium]